MNLDMIFRIILGALFATILVVRIGFERRAGAMAKDGLRQDRDTPALVAAERLLLSASGLAMIVYLLNPAWMAWSSIELPDAARWTGVVVGFVGAEILASSHRALGDNFFAGLKIRRGHQLILRGPYQWVRHPMYAAYLSLGISWFLLTGSWFVAGFWLLGTAGVIAARLRIEEQMMIEQFGDEYRDYIQRTGRFLPRLL